jgi:hypothetical protein
MGHGPSEQQRRALALLVAAPRPLDVTAELLPLLGEQPTKSARVSLLRAMRLLERRGLVSLSRHPSPRGGHGIVLASPQGTSYQSVLTAPELKRARADMTGLGG